MAFEEPKDLNEAATKQSSGTPVPGIPVDVEARRVFIEKENKARVLAGRNTERYQAKAKSFARKVAEALFAQEKTNTSRVLTQSTSRSDREYNLGIKDRIEKINEDDKKIEKLAKGLENFIYIMGKKYAERGAGEEEFLEIILSSKDPIKALLDIYKTEGEKV